MRGIKVTLYVVGFCLLVMAVFIFIKAQDSADRPLEASISLIGSDVKRLRAEVEDQQAGIDKRIGELVAKHITLEDRCMAAVDEKIKNMGPIPVRFTEPVLVDVVKTEKKPVLVPVKKRKAR